MYSCKKSFCDHQLPWVLLLHKENETNKPAVEKLDIKSTLFSLSLSKTILTIIQKSDIHSKIQLVILNKINNLSIQVQGTWFL